MNTNSNTDNNTPTNPMQAMLDRARAMKNGGSIDPTTGKVAIESTASTTKKPNNPIGAGRPAVVQKSQRGR